MNARKPRVLIAGPWLPQPPTAAMRRYELAKPLAHMCEMTLFGGVFPGGDRRQIDELRQIGVNIDEVTWDASKAVTNKPLGSWRARVRTLYFATGTAKPGHIYWQDKAMVDGRTRLRELALSGVFDVVCVEDTIAHWLSDLRLPVPVVVDYCDLTSAFYSKEAAVLRSTRHRALTLLESEKTKRYERRAARFANACTMMSGREARLLHALAPAAPTYLVPNGVDTTFFSPTPGAVIGDVTLLFTGTMGYAPNVDAVVYFVNDILPLIRNHFPNARLRIVGSSPAPEVQQLAHRPNVEVIANVPDMRPYYQQATISVVPLRYGSGTRLKILQALSMGKAVVSTSIGAEGLELSPDEIVRADGRTAFASAVVELLRDPARRAKLGQCGRSRVVNTYDWTIAASSLYRVFTTLIEGEASR